MASKIYLYQSFPPCLALSLHYFQDSQDNTETNKTCAKIIEATLENTDGKIYKILFNSLSQVGGKLCVFCTLLHCYNLAGAWHKEARVPPGLVPRKSPH